MKKVRGIDLAYSLVTYWPNKRWTFMSLGRLGSYSLILAKSSRSETYEDVTLDPDYVTARAAINRIRRARP